jgi:hypothetical protein
VAPMDFGYQDRSKSDRLSSLLPQENDIRLRIDDQRNLRRQRLKGELLLVIKRVAIVGAADPANGVAECSLGVIGVDAGAAHQTIGRCGANRESSSL